jgi:hypothetical protein
MMLVFSDIRQMREVAEGAHDLDSALVGKTIQRRFQLALGLIVVIALEAGRQLPDAFDNVVKRLTLLLAQRVAQHAAKQADVRP